MVNLKIKANTITPQSFILFVVYAIYLIYSKSTNMADLLVGLVVAALFIVLGVDHPTMSKFVKDVGLIMIDWTASPQSRLQSIQKLWMSFAAVWVEVADEVAAAEKIVQKAADITKKVEEVIKPL